MEPNQETATLELTKIAWSPLWQILVLCAGATLSFATAYTTGTVSIYVPFISETGANSPEMCIFSFSLILGSVVGSIVVCYRYLVVRHFLTNRSQKLKTMNNVATVFGLLSMLGLAGVAAIPMSTVYWAHLLAAGVHFCFALAYIILETLLNHYIDGPNKMRNCRIFLCILLMIFLLLLVIFFPLSFHKWRQVHDKPPAIKTPKDEVFGLVLTAAILEWALYATFLAFIVSFVYEFRNFRLSISVVPAENKDEET